MTDKFDHIEDYLANRLDEDARAEFERAVQTDPELAAELSLYRDMARSLAPAAPEDALRSNLDRLGRQFAPTGPSSARRWWWVAGAFVLVAFGLWWALRPGPPQPPSAPTLPGVQQGAPPVARQTPALSDPDSLKHDGPAADPEPRRLAAAFAPNSRLESMLGSRLRGDDYQFHIARPATGAVLKRRAGAAELALSGAVETTADPLDATFRVLVFSNKPRDYEAFRFVGTAPLVFEKSAAGEFRFRLTLPLRAPAGLYYYLLEDENSGVTYYVGKFRVED